MTVKPDDEEPVADESDIVDRPPPRIIIVAAELS
jgi:hypothetical protein